MPELHWNKGDRWSVTWELSHTLARQCCFCCSAGKWDISKAPELRWNEGDRWSVTRELARF